jgi:hypothetical protein
MGETNCITLTHEHIERLYKLSQLNKAAPYFKVETYSDAQQETTTVYVFNEDEKNGSFHDFVCDGRRKNDLPLKGDLKHTTGYSYAEVAYEKKDFDCPECVKPKETASADQVEVFTMEKTIDVDLSQIGATEVQEYMRHVKEGMAVGLGKMILDQGFIQFADTEVPAQKSYYQRGSHGIRGIARVVHPTKTDGILARARKQHQEVIQQAGQKIVAGIMNQMPDIIASDLMEEIVKYQVEKAFKGK